MTQVRPLKPFIEKLKQGGKYGRGDVFGLVTDASIDLDSGRLEDAVVRLELAENWFKATFPFTFGGIGVVQTHREFEYLAGDRIGWVKYRALIAEIIPKVYQ